MMKETEDVVHLDLNFLPLKSYANVIEGNALRMDWNDVVSNDKLNYIMGNPPFIGYAYQTKSQKEDLQKIDGLEKNVDYVAAWYHKAANYIFDTDIRVAFVSTNSITQGEQVCSVWKYLFDNYDFNIDFAHRTFRWDSEANLKAQVHCVIIGFSIGVSNREKIIYSSERIQKVSNINGYLLDAPNVFIKRQAKPICNVPAIYRGSQPTDNGNFIFTKDEKEELIKKEPCVEKFFRPYMMGKDFINRNFRYCLWLEGIEPSELRESHTILERVENIRKFRESSKKDATRKKASTPTLFDENHECKTDYVAIPKVSSENRRYIPMDYMKAEVIAGDKIFMMPNAGLYEFGILTSNVHMAWMRAICGRLKSDYSYSNTIVYNNFPWPETSDKHKFQIENTAQAILDARALYADSSLADLYDPLAMPIELRKAHQANDRAVMKAYGFNIKEMSEADCVAELMKMYQQLTEEK